MKLQMGKNQDINIRISTFIFMLLSVFVILFYFLAFEGLILSDDYSYAEYAWQFINSDFQFSSDIFSHRVGMILPVAALYHFFGITDTTTTLWAFVCFFLTGYVVFQYSHTSRNVRVFAFIIAILSFYPVFFSNKLFPDVVVSFFIFSTILLIWKGREKTNQRWWHAVVFVVCLWSGFLVKETILYVLPFLLLVCCVDLFNKRNYNFWIWSIVFLVLFALVYFGMYYYSTGDFFYRFTVIQAGHYSSGHSYFDKSFKTILLRITYEPLLMLLSSDLFIPVALALPKLVQLKLKNFVKLNDESNYWSIASLILLLMLWFGSTSYAYYNPISLNPRMFIIIVPLFSITSGMALHESFVRSKNHLTYFFLFLGGAIIGYVMISETTGMFYSIFSLFFLICYFGRNQEKYITPLVLTGLIVLLLIHPCYTMIKADRESFKNEREIIQTYLNTNEKAVVLTDPLIKLCSPYFYNFEPNKNYVYLSYKEVSNLDVLKPQRCYVLINPENIKELMETGYEVPDFFVDPPKRWKLVQKRGEVSLFEISGIADIPNKR